MKFPITLPKGNIIRSSLKAFGHYWDENSATILEAASLTFSVVSPFLAVRGYKKSQEYVNAHIDGTQNEETVKAIKLQSMKYYIPAVASEGLAIACGVGSHKKNKKHMSMAAATISALQTALDEYKDKAEEVFGEKGAQQINEALNSDHAIQSFKNGPAIIETGRGNTLFCEGTFTHQLFRADHAFVEDARNRLNAKYNIEGEVTAEDWLSFLDLPAAEMQRYLVYQADDNDCEPMRLDWSTDSMPGIDDAFHVFTVTGRWRDTLFR